MKLAEPLIRLFDYPVDDLARALPGPESPLWVEDESLQNTYPVHRNTRSIIFQWLEDDPPEGTEPGVKRHDYAPANLSEAAYACAAKLEAHFPGKLTLMTLAELGPRGKIFSHRDTGSIITAVHRCHIPIMTNPDVHFLIDRQSYRMEANAAYEFDNTRVHSVINQSDVRRVHLICDVMPEKASV
jgi:hypothetical protein